MRRLLFSLWLVLVPVLVAGCGGLTSIGDQSPLGESGSTARWVDLQSEAGLPSTSPDPNDPGSETDVDLVPVPGRADIILYVKSTAAGNADGSSWSNAFGDLQAALDASGGRDEPVEIWVAAGTYLPTMDHTGDTTPVDPRAKTFQLLNGVAVFGGFPAAADDQTGVADRDWQQHATILSGDLNGNGKRDGEDAYHVLHHPEGLGLDETAVLDGVIITGGYADGPGTHSYGAGMLNDHNRPTLAHVIITGNEAEHGGGIHNIGSNPHLFRVAIHDNEAVFGGGISNDGSSPTLLDSSLSNNEAALGGGMYSINGSHPNLARTTVTNNLARNDGGGLYSSGRSLATLTDATVTGNEALELGGGLFAEENSAPSLVNVVLSGNKAGHTGGGLFFGESSSNLTNVLISGNQAGEGAGMFLRNAAPTLYNVTIAGNHALGPGGGLAGIFLEPEPGSPSDRLDATESPVIHNSIIWGNTAGDGYPNVFNETSLGAPEFNNSLIQGSGGSATWDSGLTEWGSPAFGIDGGGNIDADPLFIEPVPANTGATTAGNYRLSPGSPAIDTGNADYVAPFVYTDLDGKERITGAAPDLGAYEFSPTDK